MKRVLIFIALVAYIGLVLLFACDNRKEPEKPETKVTAADVKKEANEALETAKTYSQQQKDEYLKQMEAKLQELDNEIQKLQTKAQSSVTALKAETRSEFNLTLEVLRQKKQAAAAKLDELKTASGKAWDDIKAGMDSAMEELSQAFDRAKSHFEE